MFNFFSKYNKLKIWLFLQISTKLSIYTIKENVEDPTVGFRNKQQFLGVSVFKKIINNI
jgi:hypothetical protein|tara:strand:+ start:432 stop:608 length:177 start_codon:yes stop_codon:yes gene_type:complete